MAFYIKSFRMHGLKNIRIRVGGALVNELSRSKNVVNTDKRFQEGAVGEAICGGRTTAKDQLQVKTHYKPFVETLSNKNQ